MTAWSGIHRPPTLDSDNTLDVSQSVQIIDECIRNAELHPLIQNLGVICHWGSCGLQDRYRMKVGPIGPKWQGDRWFILQMIHARPNLLLYYP